MLKFFQLFAKCALHLGFSELNADQDIVIIGTFIVVVL